MDPMARKHWLNAGRFRAYSRTAVLIGLIILAAVIHNSWKAHRAVFDFGVVWSAAHLALQGQPALAYHLKTLHAVVHALMPETVEGTYGWFYPPFVFPLIVPLALLPYAVSFALFQGVTLWGYFSVVRRIVSVRGVGWAFLGYGGLWNNLLFGQNGFLTGLLAGWALWMLEDRPLLAGFSAGLLFMKPQLAVLFPLAFLARRQWRALMAMAVTLASLVILSLLLYGFGPWHDWHDSLQLASRFLDLGGQPYWMKMPTVFAFFHLWGVPFALSMAFQVASALLAGLLVFRVWYRCEDADVRKAALVLGGLLVSPYLFSYDLTLLVLPLAWMVRSGLRRGWLPGEREGLIGLWVFPAILLLLGDAWRFQMGPWVLWGGFWLVCRRARWSQGS